MSIEAYKAGAIEQRTGAVKRKEAVIALRGLGLKGLEASKGILSKTKDKTGNTVVRFRSAKAVARWGYKDVTDASVVASLERDKAALKAALAWTIGDKPAEVAKPSSKPAKAAKK